MSLQYSITELPPVWPGKRTTFKKRAPFKVQWSKLTHQLERELKYLGARKVELAMDLPRGAVDIRQDGMLRADARPRPAVILSFIDSDGQRQAYPCDTFGWWQDNLWAIAVVLEDLRRAERYGVQSALLRAGFKALPAQATTTMSAQQAAEALSAESDATPMAILANVSNLHGALRVARFRTHPDRNGGSRTRYDRVEQARETLAKHFGVSL